MLDAILRDVGSVFRATFLSGDLTAIAIAAGAVLIAAAMMRRTTQIGSMTLLSLVIFAIGGYVRGYLGGAATTSDAVAGRAAGQLEASWLRFSNMEAGTLLAYFLAFMAAILILFGVKLVLSRG
ncbi:MAG: hypothetical protein AAGA09_06650 [Pseudomonadota bacterium]